MICIKLNPVRERKEKGFTLVELAVAMVIIALLITGIMAGQDLIESAKIKSTISQIEEHQTAFNVFVDKYSAYPGDYARADQFLGATIGENGDGNTQIVWITTNGLGQFEGALAWYHLKLAGLTQGQFGGTPMTSGTFDGVPTTVVPTSKLGGEGGGYYMNYDGAVGGLGNVLGLGLYGGAGTGINDDPYITTQQAYDIDRKLDDSVPTTGLVRAYPLTVTPPTPECIDSAGGGNTYLLTSNSVACTIEYKLD